MIAKLEPEFMPMVKVINDYKEAVKQADSQEIAICVERNNSLMAVYKLDIFKEGTGHDQENYEIAERIIKTLLFGQRAVIRCILQAANTSMTKLRMITEWAERENLTLTSWHGCMRHRLKLSM